MIEKAKGKSNVQSLSGVKHIPSDAQIRNLLDPQEPELLDGVLRKGHELLRAGGQMEAFGSYAGQYLISCDGTGTISSQQIHCENCSQREMVNGEVLYIHYAILPVIVKAGDSRVLVLEPEFICPQDGHEKPDSYIALYEQVEFLPRSGAVEQVRKRRWNGRYAEIEQYCLVNEVPIRCGEEALSVNWCEITITREDTGRQLYHNSFITHHTLNRSNVVAMVRDGQARWKSENETNNVLKTKGYHLEHNFGHGQQHLVNFMLTLTLLAFLFHTLLDLLDEQYRAVRHELVARQDFFNDLRALLRYMLFDNWRHLMHFMLVGLELIPDT